MDVEIRWDNSADNPRNPSNPPVRVAWGEESKEEMGSVSLIVVPHEESDLVPLREELLRRRNDLARSRMRSDPALAMKIMQLLAE